MRLAIGDVVRDRTDMVIGTVARIEINEARRVLVNVPGSFPRPVSAKDLEIVSRYTQPATARLRLMAVFVFLVALLTSYVAGHSVRLLGGDWLLTFMAALGAYEIYEIAFRWARRLTGARRFRI